MPDDGMGMMDGMNLPGKKGKPFGDDEMKKLEEVGAEADEMMAKDKEKPAEGAPKNDTEADVKVLVDGLSITEESARKVLDAARKDPDLKDMAAKDLVDKLMDDSNLLMDLMSEGYGPDQAPPEEPSNVEMAMEKE